MDIPQSFSHGRRSRRKSPAATGTVTVVWLIRNPNGSANMWLKLYRWLQIANQLPPLVGWLLDEGRSLLLPLALVLGLLAGQRAFAWWRGKTCVRSSPAGAPQPVSPGWFQIFVQQDGLNGTSVR